MSSAICAAKVSFTNVWTNNLLRRTRGNRTVGAIGAKGTVVYVRARSVPISIKRPVWTGNLLRRTRGNRTVGAIGAKGTSIYVRARSVPDRQRSVCADNLLRRIRGNRTKGSSICARTQFNMSVSVHVLNHWMPGV
jgi:hypothetical protein